MPLKPGVQSFQSWVYWKVPEGGDLAQTFLTGAHPLHIARSALMLLAIFGLVFIYFAVCFSFYLQNKAGAILAFLGFFVFFLIEITLRSVELFYFQIQLPKQYTILDPSARVALLRSFEAFQAVRHALYFPLMFAPTIGSIVLLTIIPRERIHWPIQVAFLLNAVRDSLRIVADYLGWDILGPKFTDRSYLPLVYMIFGLTAYWLVSISRSRLVQRQRDERLLLNPSGACCSGDLTRAVRHIQSERQASPAPKGAGGEDL